MWMWGACCGTTRSIGQNEQKGPKPKRRRTMLLCCRGRGRRRCRQNCGRGHAWVALGLSFAQHRLVLVAPSHHRIIASSRIYSDHIPVEAAASHRALHSLQTYPQRIPIPRECGARVRLGYIACTVVASTIDNRHGRRALGLGGLGLHTLNPGV